MKYIKTVKRFVTGSDKFFDIFDDCLIEDVEETRDANGRKNIRIMIDGKEYRGMFNKSVFEHLLEHEGKTTYVVLWKSNKGNHMIAYLWDLWTNYANNVADEDVSSLSEVEYRETGEAFVYLWIDKTSDKKYIGKHKGTPDDGYQCSNKELLVDLNDRPQDFVRTILAYGTDQQMHELETMLLLQLGAARGEMYYNLSNNLRK